jgi:hypothetical protein
MQGNVYDYTRHIKSILFGDNFEGWLANLMDSNMRWLRDMLGLGNKSQLILVGIENGGKDFGIYTAGTAAGQSGIGSISRIGLWG